MPSSTTTLDVIDPSTEGVYFRVAAAQQSDIAHAVGAAREAFDSGPWPRMTHGERAAFLRAMADGLRERTEDFGQIWPRESGALHSIARFGGLMAAGTFDYYAGLADIYPFEEAVTPTMGGEFGLLVREPVGVVGAIIPWNGPLSMIATKVAPALLSGCTMVVKSSPEAPGEGYLVAEIAEAVGLPAGVLNVLTADREVSEHLVRDPRVDKITFTGSTAAGRRIAAICGERIARCTLGARWQVGSSRARRCRHRHRGDDHRAHRVHAYRAGVLIAYEGDRDGGTPRPTRRGAGGDLRASSGGGSIRSVERDGSTRNKAAASTGSRVTSPEESRMERSWSQEVVALRISTWAGTSNPPSSPASTTTRTDRP